MNQSTILIVDDDLGARETMEALLRLEGYDIILAETGMVALKLLESALPDVILLDIMMPGMTGYEVCRRIRATPHLAEIPILLVTALDDREARLEGIQAGADDFITKPFDRIELRARVRNITKLNRYNRLMAERTKFEWVVDHAEDGYLILDDEDVIRYINPQAKIHFDIPTESDPVGKNFSDVVNGSYQQEPEASWRGWPVNPDPQTSRYLVRPETENADAFWLQVDLLPMWNAEGAQHLVRLQDVTANVVNRRVMWSFQTQISHKLKTPLTLLKGSFQFLYDQLHDDFSEDDQLLLEMAHKGVTRLEEEITSVLNFVGREAPKGRGDQKTSIAEFASAIVEARIRAGISASNLSLNFFGNKENIFVGLPVQSFGLVVEELFNNARKFHPEYSPRVEIEIVPKENSVLFCVRDDGVNLTPVQLQKIWSPYYQAEKRFSGQVPGSGLGLSMVASIIWSSGGTCHAYNRDRGTGLVIEISLPRVD